MRAEPLFRNALKESPPLAVGEREAARLLGVSSRTLFTWRTTLAGPRHVRVGARVLYAVDELRRWLDAAAAGNTLPTVASPAEQAVTDAPGGGR